MNDYGLKRHRPYVPHYSSTIVNTSYKCTSSSTTELLFPYLNTDEWNLVPMLHKHIQTLLRETSSQRYHDKIHQSE